MSEKRITIDPAIFTKVRDTISDLFSRCTVVHKQPGLFNDIETHLLEIYSECDMLSKKYSPVPESTWKEKMACCFPKEELPALIRNTQSSDFFRTLLYAVANGELVSGVKAIREVTDAHLYDAKEVYEKASQSKAKEFTKKLEKC